MPRSTNQPPVPRPAPSGRPVYGAIDLGTNNCRLLLAEPDSEGFRVLDGFSRIVRLGEGLSRTGRLSEPAMIRTLEALEVCAAKADRLNVRQIRCVATEACRRAENGEDFLARVRARTGLVFEIVTPQTEAGLTLAGCAPLLTDRPGNVLLFDIGGGSTEIIWVAGPQTEGWRPTGILSIPVGVVTLAEDHGPTAVDAAHVAAIRRQIDEQIAPFCRHHAIRRAVEDRAVAMLGTSGTVTTLGAIQLGLERYDRSRIDGLRMPRRDVARISRELLHMDIERRRELPCIGRDRADLMVMGCAILDAIIGRWPVEFLQAADRGIRDGLLMAMIDADRVTAGQGHGPTACPATS